MVKLGPKNLITDVPGIRIGNADSLELMSGVTTVFPEKPAVAAVDVRGGGPGSRETEALTAECTVDQVHAIVLSGGSAYGLAAADGVMAWLAQQKIGFQLGSAVVPIVPSAILFDLLNGGNKNWGMQSPYFDLGTQSVENTQTSFTLGNVGAGMGAKAGDIKGGLGSSSFVLVEGDQTVMIGALAAVNSMGTVTMPHSSVMWAAPYEQNQELGGQPSLPENYQLDLDYSFQVPAGTNTTLVVVATDAILDKSQAKRVAIMAQDGLARAIRPIHSPLDGDTVFVVSTGQTPLSDPVGGLAKLGMLAADCVARAVARGVYEAESIGDWESYRSRHGHLLKHT